MPIPNLKVTLKYVFCVLSNCFIKYCNIQFYYNIGRNVSCITIHLYALEFQEGYGAMFRLFNISPHCTHIYFLISYNILYIINIVIRFFFHFPLRYYSQRKVTFFSVMTSYCSFRSDHCVLLLFLWLHLNGFRMYYWQSDRHI